MMSPIRLTLRYSLSEKVVECFAFVDNNVYGLQKLELLSM